MNPTTSSAAPDLSIIIVNWKSKAFVEKCLGSIAVHAAPLTTEIFVVDNASYDGCDAMISDKFPHVTYLQSPRNVGFSRANNLAVARSTGRHILFLNPDTEILANALSELVAVLEGQPGCGMVGARLLNSDLSLQSNCITALPTIANQMLSSNLLRKRFPKSALWGMQPHFSAPVPAPVEAISGACMLVKRGVIEALGGFNTDYFMYCEDMDLCARLARGGWKIYYAPQAAIVHHAGGSSASRSESSFSSIMIRESLIRFFSLHHGRAYAAVYRASTILAASARLLLLCLLLPAAISSKGNRLLSRALRKWGSIWMWSVGLSAWANRQVERNGTALGSSAVNEVAGS